MRFLVLALKTDEAIQPHVINDLAFESYGDFHFEQFDVLLKQNGLSKLQYDALSEIQRKKKQFQMLMAKMSTYTPEGNLPRVCLPTQPHIVLLQGFDLIAPCGTVTLIGIQKKEPSNYQFSKKLEISVYCSTDDAGSPKRKDKNIIDVTTYQVGDKLIQNPVQTAIIQQLQFEFYIREAYLNVLERSNVINISGHSLHAQVIPSMYCTVDDEITTQLYDVKKQSQKQVSIYNSILNEIYLDQNEIPCIVGAMMDSVLATTDRKPIPSDLIVFEDELLDCECEKYQQKLEHPSISEVLSVFDGFGQQFHRYQTDLGKTYLCMAVNSIIRFYRDDQSQLSPQDNASRLTQLSELTRTFIRDARECKTDLLQAESVMRKSLLAQVFDQSASSQLDIADSCTVEQLKEHQYIKLGGDQTHNNLQVLSILLNNRYPAKITNGSSNLCNSKYYKIEPTRGENGIVETLISEKEMRGKIEIDTMKLCRALDVPYDADVFRCFAGQPEEFAAQLMKLVVIKQADAKKKDDITTLAFQHPNSQEIIELIDPTVEKVKKGPKKALLNPYLPQYGQQVAILFQYMIHERFFEFTKQSNFEENYLHTQLKNYILELLQPYNAIYYGYNKAAIKVAAKDKKDKNEVDKLEPLQFIGTDSHLPFAALHVLLLGDEKEIFYFNNIIKDMRIITAMAETNPAKESPLKTKMEMSQTFIFDNQYTGSNEAIYFGNTAQNIIFMGAMDQSGQESMMKSLIAALSPQQLLNNQFIKGAKSLTIREPISETLQIQFGRPVCDQSIFTADKSVISATDSKITLVQQLIPDTTPAGFGLGGCSEVITLCKESDQVKRELSVEVEQSSITSPLPVRGRFDAIYSDQRVFTSDQQLIFQWKESQLICGIIGQIKFKQPKLDFEFSEKPILNGVKIEDVTEGFVLDRNLSSNVQIAKKCFEKRYSGFPKTEAFELCSVYVNQGVTLSKIKCKFNGAVFEDNQQLNFLEINQSLLVVYNDVVKMVFTPQGDQIVLRNSSVQVLKHNGQMMSFFNVEASNSDFQAKFKPQKIESASTYKKKDTKDKNDDKKEERSSLIFSSPILLISGNQYPTGQAVLGRRVKFISKQNITTRIIFDLQRKLHPTLTGSDTMKKLEINDPFQLIQDMMNECLTQYKDVPPNTYNLQWNLLQKQNYCRLHHEMFIPPSDTIVSKLQGVYRFILGSENREGTPFYPSVSCYDWAGNTIHVRLGALSGESFVQKMQVKKDAGKKTETIETVEQKLYYQDSTKSIIAPANMKTVQSDDILMVTNLIEQREKDAIEELLNERKAKASPILDDKKKKPKQADEAQQFSSTIYEPRKIDSIINELIKVVVKSPFNAILDAFLGEQSTIQPRLEKVVAVDEGIKLFLEKQSALVPNFAQQIAQTRYLIVPNSYEPQKGHTIQLENDAPWLVFSKEDGAHLLYFCQLQGFIQQKGTHLVPDADGFALRITEGLQSYFRNIQSLDQQKVLEIVSQIKTLVMAHSSEEILLNIKQHKFERVQQVIIHKFLSKEDMQMMPSLERVKQIWKKMRCKASDTQAIEAQNLEEVAMLLCEERKDSAREKERLKQRQVEQEIEVQLQKERINSQPIKQDVVLTDDYFIDKPMKRAAKKAIVGHKAKPPALEPDVDDDDDFTKKQILDPRFQKQYAFMKGAENMVPPPILTKIQDSKGQKIGKVLKITPDRINSKNDKNSIIVKNLTKDEVTVGVASDEKTVIDPCFVLKPFEVKLITVSHKQFGDGELLFSTKDEEIVVEIYW